MPRALAPLRRRPRGHAAKKIFSCHVFFLNPVAMRVCIEFSTHSHVPMAHRGYATT
jgi:hypothetical protein